MNFFVNSFLGLYTIDLYLNKNFRLLSHLIWLRKIPQNIQVTENLSYSDFTSSQDVTESTGWAVRKKKKKVKKIVRICENLKKSVISCENTAGGLRKGSRTGMSGKAFWSVWKSIPVRKQKKKKKRRRWRRGNGIPLWKGSSVLREAKKPGGDVILRNFCFHPIFPSTIRLSFPFHWTLPHRAFDDPTNPFTSILIDVVAVAKTSATGFKRVFRGLLTWSWIFLTEC